MFKNLARASAYRWVAKLVADIGQHSAWSLE